jgi:hypothetical protein
MTEGDLRWTLLVGGTADDLYTIVEVILPDGCRTDGGLGAQPTYPRHRVNYATHHGERCAAIVGRAKPEIYRIRIQLEAGSIDEPSLVHGQLTSDGGDHEVHDGLL